MKPAASPALRVLVRYPTRDRALRTAIAYAAKHGPKFVLIEARDPAGGGDAYPYAVVTPYAYRAGQYIRP